MDKVLAILAMLGNIGNDIVFKRVADLSEGRNAYLFFTLQALLIIPLCVLGIWVLDVSKLFDLKSILYGIPIGILTFFYYFFALKCLETGNVAVNVTIYRLNFVTAGILAVIFLNETITLRKGLGFALCLLAILLFFLSNRRIPGSGYPATLYSLAACLIGGGLTLVVKMAMDNGASIFPTLLYRYVVTALIGSAALLMRRDSWRAEKSLYTHSALSGAIIMMSLYFSFAALKIGEITVVMPIIQVGFVFMGALAFVFWKEKIDALKIAGILAGVASIVIIA